MSSNQDSAPTDRRALRVWPGVIAVILQWLLWMVLPLVVPRASLYSFLGAVACGVVVLAWWLLFSRAAWPERVGVMVLMVASVAATSRIVHASISNGMMGMMLPLYAIPALSLALVAWVVASRRLSTRSRRAAMVVAVLLACAPFALIRTGGITGEGESDLHWRWTPTPEERLLALAADEPLGAPAARETASPAPPAAALPEPQPAARAAASETASAPAAGGTPDTRPPDDAVGHRQPAAGRDVAAAPAAITTPPPDLPVAHVAMPATDWPGFRGPGRDGVVPGVRIETDWSRKAPVELWRRPIGPGWSSFAVHGDLVYTQEQRGDDEVVSCYQLSTGEPVWQHRDAIRFWESNGGAGPRATPTFSNGRVYTMGASRPSASSSPPSSRMATS